MMSLALAAGRHWKSRRRILANAQSFPVRRWWRWFLHRQSPASRLYNSYEGFAMGYDRRRVFELLYASIPQELQRSRWESLKLFRELDRLGPREVRKRLAQGVW